MATYIHPSNSRKAKESEKDPANACIETNDSSQNQCTEKRSSCKLRVVEAVAAAAPPPQGLVVGVLVAVGERVIIRRANLPDPGTHRGGLDREGRDLDRRAWVAQVAPVVAARRRGAQPDLVLHRHSLLKQTSQRIRCGAEKTKKDGA
ncbi:hypothetical protein BHM03_00004675 [Ensete ventricosum]|nr:hypothetical protein BHM03_00004675 [Ensete ventricosum]